MAISQEEREEQRLKRLATLRASYEMYERTKEDTKKRHKTAKDKHGNKMYNPSETKKNLELLETMQQDVYDEYVQLGGNPEDLKLTNKKNTVDRRALEEIMKQESMKDEMAEMVRNMNKQEQVEEEPEYGYYPTEDEEVSKFAATSLMEHEKTPTKHTKKAETFNKKDNKTRKRCLSKQ